MAKKIKPVVAETKKVEEVKPIEKTVKVGAMAAEPKDSLATIIEQPKLGDTPSSVTLDEVKQVKEEPVVELKIPETVTIDNVPIKVEVVDISMEQQVINFIESRSEGEIKMNDFLKSLFGVAKVGEPPLWQNQGATKQIKVLLDKLHNAGEIEVCGNAHLKLGTTYYPDTTTMRAAQYDLGSVPVFCKKVN